MDFFAWVFVIFLATAAGLYFFGKPLLKWGLRLLAKKAAQSMQNSSASYQKNYGQSRYSAEDNVHLKDDTEVIIPQEVPTREKVDRRYTNVEDVEFEDAD